MWSMKRVSLSSPGGGLEWAVGETPSLSVGPDDGLFGAA